ncbi:hypothetical protein [Pyrococcus kukulkanii]|uniref:Uncharacterized protein n=1 Tax=Pyrococcus kukulkanii TaxID=1609559 RepID=A0A127BAU8_9EURY|nr:hypothetical protein [Pyrococcus kukulkanii]AMM54471.1 hypothetical protein TQ32_08250 [Pyrococcus kukulkanii]
MGYYEEIPGFEYWNVEAWKKYIRDYIGPIYSTTKTLLKLKDYLERYVGKSLKAVKEDDERVLKFFVGGIDESGNYTERSLAKLIRLMYGIYVEPTEFVSAVEAVGEEGLEGVEVLKEKEESGFLKLIEKLNDLSSGVLEKSGTKVEVTPTGEILTSPNKLLDVLKELYEASVSFSVPYNPYTFFILTTNDAHWRALKSMYTKLPEVFEKLSDLLGLEPIFIPPVDSEKLRKEYTIWSHKIGGIANRIYKMQTTLWVYFSFHDYWYFRKVAERTLEVFKFITPSPEDLLITYAKTVKEALKDWQEIEKVPNEFKEAIKPGRIGTNYYILILRGSIITKIHYEAGSRNSRDYKGEFSLLRLLDILAPPLLLGNVKIMPTNKNPNALIYYKGIFEGGDEEISSNIYYFSWVVSNNVKDPERWF